jgi:hypothetical protein
MCIDQSNNKERAEQVMLMTLLYQKAASVIAWIGQEDETTGAAFTVVEELSSISVTPGSPADTMALSEAYSYFGSIECFLNPDFHRSKLGIKPLSETNWLAWLALMHRPYFKRAWVVQEVTLAKSITTVCGSRVFDWQKLSKAIWFLAYTKWYLMMHTEYFRRIMEGVAPAIYSKMISQNIDSGVSAMALNQTRNGTQSAGELYTLESLLKFHGHCEASDPRDMIYALQGIARKDAKPFNSHGHLMAPDYTISVENLYARTARIMMQAYGDLRFLNPRNDKRWRQLSKLPSWVPDYSVKLMPDALAMRGPNCNWRANGTLEWKVDTRLLYDPLLDVQGILVGRIMDKSENNQENDHPGEVWGSFCKIALGIQTCEFITCSFEY